MSLSWVNYLKREELIFEIEILSGNKKLNSENIESLRKTIRKLLKDSTHKQIVGQEIESYLLHCDENIENILDKYDKYKSVPSKFKSLIERSKYYLHCLNRINTEDKKYLSEISQLKSKITKLISTEESDFESIHSSEDEDDNEDKPAKVVYVTERHINLNSINLKYDGTTCVRNFVKRLEELRLSRGYSETQIYNGFVEILEKSALDWFRCNKPKYTNYRSIVKHLQIDFDLPDLDYQLLNTIRNTKQSSNQTLTTFIYSILGMFNRLNRTIPDQDKLEILLHNVRPEYIKELAMRDINSIEELQTIGRKLELAWTMSNTASSSTDRQPKQVGSVDKSKSKYNSNSNRMFCSSCKMNNHNTTDCYKNKNKSRNFNNKLIKCFGCGKPNVTKPNCPNCNRPKN